MTPTAAMAMVRLRFRDLVRYFGGLSVRGAEVIGKFGLYALAAREMGAHDSGLFFLCLTWVNLASTAARMGLERAMSRHVAAELAVGNGAAARHAVTSGMAWITLASVVLGALTWLVAEPASLLVFHEPGLVGPLRVAALVLLPQSLAFALGFALIGLGRGISGQIVQSALPPVLSLAALLAGMNHANTVLYAYSLSYTLSCCLGFALLVIDWRGPMAVRPADRVQRPDALPPLWVTARPFLVIELVQSALLSLPVLVLGVFAQASVVSAFSIANRLTMMINTVLVSLALISAPAFARHHRLHQYAELRHAERQTRILAIVVCLPMIAVMMIIPQTLLSFLGRDFTTASLALEILSIGQLVNVWLPTQDMMLAMTGHGRILQRVNLYQLVVCAVLCAALIPPFGLLGAALVTTICLVQGRIGFAFAVRRVIPQLFGPLPSMAT
jgi:O-antigen/teichoic acid export membrane protein